MGKLIEGLWDCSYCGTKGVKGRYRECPHCGTPRGTDVKFYLPDKITYVPAEEAIKINRNPDWVCSFCETLNSDDSERCLSCGASKRDSEMDYFQNRAKQAEKERQRFEGQKRQERLDGSRPSEPVEAVQRIFRNAISYFRHNKLYVSTVAFACFIMLSLVVLFAVALQPKIENVTIESFRWERNIKVEELQTFQESGWTLPANARLLYTTEELYQSQNDNIDDNVAEVSYKVAGFDTNEDNKHSGFLMLAYDDLGNGYFEDNSSDYDWGWDSSSDYDYDSDSSWDWDWWSDDSSSSSSSWDDDDDETVYKTRYYYEIDKWVFTRSVLTSGSDKSPYWGDVVFRYNERECYRTEYYYVTVVTADGKLKEYEFDFDEWNALNIGDNVNIRIRMGRLAKLELSDNE